MKYLFFFALAFLSVTLPAQNTATTTSSSCTSVKESVNNGNYAFSIKVDRKQVDNLVSAYIKVAKISGISKIVGTSTHTTDKGAVMKLNTKKRTLSVSSADDRPSSMDVAVGLADQLREELNLAPASAPPAPPRIDRQ